ncbi:CAP domain-containing protein [Levilactobacillus enshiensis]|uniref:CAP domain-containing protein n=1 Tax=Levilactobacillus enshiensis TaxID=2590213 RepID=UPI00117A1BF2|nr:CAP domain-containing protein [Levilactobacillus enshiensis]
MKLSRQLKGLLVLVLAIGGIASVTPAAAKQSSKGIVLKMTKVTTKPYHATKGKIYRNTSLTKVAHNAKNYPRTTLYVTKHATIRKANHQRAVYYYIGKGKAKGWIWHGYLKAGKVAKKSTTKSTQKSVQAVATTTTATTTTQPTTKTAFDAAKMSQNFLAIVNQERAKVGVAPLTLNSKLTNLANQRAKDNADINTLSHTDAQGNAMFEKEADQFGVGNWLTWSECLYMSGYDSLSFNFGKDAADGYLYDDADSNWGHRLNLISSETTQIGIGWYVKSGTHTVYNAIDQTN